MSGIQPESQEIVSEVREHDVLLGRGSGSNENLGNVRFRKLVREFLRKAMDSVGGSSLSSKSSSLRAFPNERKELVAIQVVDRIKSSKGRFLVRRSLVEANKALMAFGRTEHTLSDLKASYYRVISDQEAVKKTKAAIRFQLDKFASGSDEVLLGPNRDERMAPPGHLMQSHLLPLQAGRDLSSTSVHEPPTKTSEAITPTLAVPTTARPFKNHASSGQDIVKATIRPGAPAEAQLQFLQESHQKALALAALLQAKPPQLVHTNDSRRQQTESQSILANQMLHPAHVYSPMQAIMHAARHQQLMGTALPRLTPPSPQEQGVTPLLPSLANRNYNRDHVVAPASAKVGSELLPSALSQATNNVPASSLTSHEMTGALLDRLLVLSKMTEQGQVAKNINSFEEHVKKQLFQLGNGFPSTTISARTPLQNNFPNASDANLMGREAEYSQLMNIIAESNRIESLAAAIESQNKAKQESIAPASSHRSALLPSLAPAEDRPSDGSATDFSGGKIHSESKRAAQDLLGRDQERSSTNQSFRRKS